MRIELVQAYEVLDSRGQPTIEARVQLEQGSVGIAMVPSGASTGAHEAIEKRDGDHGRYGGRGVEEVAKNVRELIGPAIVGIPADDQMAVDMALIDVDGTPNKNKLGANALLAVSLAVARAAANYFKQPLWRYLGGIAPKYLPVPMMNILNGGAHADNNVDLQEFMIVPVVAPSFKEALRIGTEIWYSLKGILKYQRMSTNVGDEGGFAPSLPDNEAALQLIVEAITQAGYKPGEEIFLALDVAATEFYKEGSYNYQNNHISSNELISLYEKWINKYPIISIEDGLAEDDWAGWSDLTKKLGNRVQLVGDDLFVTQRKRLAQGIDNNIANALLVKLNQVGTLTETWQAISDAKQANYATIISHRSGETEDPFIADLAVASCAKQIKTGAPCRSDRLAKYNQLLRIEMEATNAIYAGKTAFKHMLSK